jgi:hypothetical protein
MEVFGFLREVTGGQLGDRMMKTGIYYKVKKRRFSAF